MKTKALSRLEIKDEDRGEFAAIFSTFNAIDSDGDVTLPGAFTDGQKVRVSAYGHESWFGRLPVGKGVIRTTASEAVCEGQFFMDVAAARETFVVVKEMGELQEWSYGYDAKTSLGEFAGQRVRFLEAIEVHEVSPVLKGAGVGTRTLAVKGAKQLSSDLRQQLSAAGRERFGAEETWVWLRDYDVDELYAIYEVESDDALQLWRVDFSRVADGAVALADGASEVMPVTSYAPKGAHRSTPKQATTSMRFTEHATSVVADVRVLIDRAAEVLAVRGAKGKTLGEVSTDLLGWLEADLKRLHELLAAPSPAHADELAREYARFVQITQGVH